MARPFILGLGGTAREGSASERAMRVALEHAQALGADTEVFAGSDLLLPHYRPGNTGRTAGAARLVELFRRADGIILCSPAYHGSTSGLIKNAIDYSEDLRRDERVYWDGRAIGCICCAGGWQGGAQVLATLRAVAHALRGWPTPFGAIVNTTLPAFDTDGKVVDTGIRQQLQTVGAQVVDFAIMKLAAGNWNGDADARQIESKAD